jgi:hypothetical protein
MAWTPSIRHSWQFDFEDRFEDEAYDDEGFVLFLPEEPNEIIDHFNLRDDQDARDVFMNFAFECSENGSNPDPGMEDKFLRKAAQRGEMEAMVMLMNNRYLLEHDSEALRWSRRILSRKYLVGEHNTAEMISGWLSDAQKVSDWADENNIGTTHGFLSLTADASDDPEDIGEHFKKYNCFCLLCGKLKFPTADPGQCDDSVHMVLHNFGRNQ